MKIKIITVLGYKIKFIKDGVEYYKDKIKHFSNTEILIPKIKDNFTSKNEKLKKQGEAVCKMIGTDDFVILCDINGKMIESTGFAKEFEKILNLSKNIVFVIGGDEGVSDDIILRSNLRISFSKMTFNHELFTVMLLEQIYRAFCIIKNYPYHK